MTKACVIGWPIKHSRSPLIHNYWIKLHKLDGLYERVAVEPKNLTEFIRNLGVNGYGGCNVTLPHKEAVLSAVDEYDLSASQTGSINTVFLKGKKIYGTSTDGQGFLSNILSVHPDFQLKSKTVFLIGAGGSAKAICQTLLREEVRVIYALNRTEQRINDLQKIFGTKIQPVASTGLSQCLAASDILINTTSLGMTGQPPLGVDLSKLPKTALVADIVYIPLKTQLILNAESLGLKTVPGLGMLLHQAVEGFNLWFGVRPQVTPELYDLVAHDIATEHNR